MEKDIEINEQQEQLEKEKRRKKAIAMANIRKRRKKKLALLILLLLITGVMLGTSTYAWFTSNRNVEVSDINVKVSASNGLQLSVDAVTWKTVISNADILGVTTEVFPTVANQLPKYDSSAEGNKAEVIPVSTSGQLNGDKLKMYKGTLTNNATTGATELTTKLLDSTTDGESQEVAGANASGYYVAFDLFVKVDDASDVYLTHTSGVTLNENSVSSGIQNAARMGFVVEGNTSSSSTSTDMQKLGTGTGASPTVYIWEPNYDTHTGAGLNAAAAYHTANADYAAAPTASSDNPAYTYYGVNSAFGPVGYATTLSTQVTAMTTTVLNWQTKASYTDASSTAKYDKFLSLSAGVTKIRVYMWIEGQDIDCENSASGGQITYSLGFSLDDEKASS